MTLAAVDAHDWELARTSLRRLIEHPDTAGLAARLQEFGWTDLLSTDPAQAVGIVFELAGESLAPGWLLDEVVASELQPGGVDGSVGVVYEAPAGSAAIVEGGTVAVDGLSFAPPAARTAFLVAIPGGIVRVAAADLDTSPVAGLDASLGLQHVRGAVSAGELDHVDDPGAERATRAVATGRRALAHELVAVAERLVAMGVDHAREREQFGVAIGSFQAVAHRLADAHVATVAAREVLGEAWRDLDPRSAALAKHWAGRAARLAARHSQQVLGGVGFTWEHPLHRYVRRALVLDGLLGSSASLARDLGRRLRRDGSLPRLANLT